MTDLSVIDRTRATLRNLGQQRGPILVGPWLSEVGFELLYWVPFLRWACAFAKLNPEDIWIVSRGGCRSWYQDISRNYIDVLEFFTPDEFRHGNELRIAEQSKRAAKHGLRPGSMSPKQHEISVFDEAIIARVREKTGHGFQRVLHPSLMYAFFKPYWRRKADDLYAQSTKVKRLTPPEPVPGLPASYVAMKFYASNALPGTDMTRRLIRDIVYAQARTSDVVLLQSGARYDDHESFAVPAHPRVHHVDLPPAENLDIQTAVIAKASSFIGTYGGFAYLAPFLGVSTLALYGVENFRKDHRDLMRKLAAQTLRVPFEMADLAQGHDELTKRGRRAA